LRHGQLLAKKLRHPQKQLATAAEWSNPEGLKLGLLQTEEHRSVDLFPHQQLTKICWKP